MNVVGTFFPDALYIYYQYKFTGFFDDFFEDSHSPTTRGTLYKFVVK